MLVCLLKDAKLQHTHFNEILAWRLQGQLFLKGGLPQICKIFFIALVSMVPFLFIGLDIKTLQRLNAISNQALQLAGFFSKAILKNFTSSIYLKKTPFKEKLALQPPIIDDLNLETL